MEESRRYDQGFEIALIHYRHDIGDHIKSVDISHLPAHRCFKIMEDLAQLAEPFEGVSDEPL